MQSNRIIQVEEKVPPRLLVPLSIQHMFAMFGASVLVPFIFKMNPAIVLFMNGIGTLLFILITKGKAPAYLGSSFAFIAPATIVINNWGYQYALGGFVVVGACGCVLAFIIYKCGTDWINVVLPPAAMGPVVALIGLELAGSAASTGCIVGDSVTTGTVITFLVTLAVAVFGSVLFRGFFSTMISGFIGSVPTTTYGENIGVMAITKVYSVRVIGGAAVLSIICSFVGPLAALIQTIPGPVIGGISFLLYGMIGTSGLRILVDNHVDYSKNRNMILTSVIFVTGLSGVTLALGDVSLSGMTLAAIVGMIMSLVFYAFDKFHLSNDA